MEQAKEKKYIKIRVTEGRTSRMDCTKKHG
jgi:hypothetical protein